MTIFRIKCHIGPVSDSGTGVTRVDVYDDIGAGFFQDGITAADFAGSLASVKGALEVHINSGGGNVFEGVAIAEAVRSYKGKVTTIVDGVAASIASFIFESGSEREMAQGSMLMIHDATGMCEGNAEEMAKSADVLSKVSDSIANQYARRAGGTKDDWRKAMLAETWYTDEEAVAAGLADRIVGEEAASWPAGLDLKSFAIIPGRIAASIRSMPVTAGTTPPADPPGPDMQDANNGYVKRDGKWVFDPDNDGDDDATPAGDKDHDYWAADGTQLKAIPSDPDGKQGKPLASSQKTEPRSQSGFPVLDAAVDTTAWDASKAWAAGAKSQDPAAFYRGICAGRKSGDPATQGAWALPYKYSPGSAPNAAGVKNALARLPQTQGLTNADAAKSKLQGIMKEIDPGYEPSGKVDPAVLRAALALPDVEVDDSEWDPALAWAAGAQAEDPAYYYRGICAGRRSGNPATREAWALPYRYSPTGPPNAQGVREALAHLSRVRFLTNQEQARGVLETALAKISPSGPPSEQIDMELLSAVFSAGLEGANK